MDNKSSGKIYTTNNIINLQKKMYLGNNFY